MYKFVTISLVEKFQWRRIAVDGTVNPIVVPLLVLSLFGMQGVKLDIFDALKLRQHKSVYKSH